MGTTINGPTFIYGDNQFILANTTGPDSAWKKKSNSIAFHFFEKEQQEMSGDPLILSLIKIHLIY